MTINRVVVSDLESALHGLALAGWQFSRNKRVVGITEAERWERTSWKLEGYVHLLHYLGLHDLADDASTLVILALELKSDVERADDANKEVRHAA